ncbi:ileal sodium/bile acid cotransporter-like isoform X2 [Bradysia coprophila]|uniref:ileal sodium/bile acid cotransporter-like isoform X2 n=1 Tax=Bradysia coprophila TaxID=38358 RepID=UPI00187DB5B2|nr:ileal sodium/bile acid cotransporter-like isoform X2 [Bradysia coprophila]XP_037025030.1 ileal sodium/bile acid cotransporter-like isoform X2 [Bradysia coprophila]XP_037025031.1 ileal sodium/bile acid cotransporter-like isoform X2 [Bradysia coprophila]
MCPLFSQYVLVILFIGPIFLLCSAFTASFDPSSITVQMHTTQTVNLTLEGLPELSTGSYVHIGSSDNQIAEVSKQIQISEINAGRWSGSFDVHGVFLGSTSAFVELIRPNVDPERADSRMSLTIIRESRAIDHAFTGSVIVLVALLYINFGAALDLTKLRGIITRPIGPAIGFCGQFIVMPLLGFGLAYLLFPNRPDLQLGLFFTGCSPAGGASNIWTVILGGNMDLSVTMTSISTIAAFGMMPLWIFTLGRVIFDQAELDVPYASLAQYVAALVIPLAVGLLIQRYLPRVCKILVRILKPLSILLILFIVIFAIVTNLYLFELFSWQILVAGLGLPWIGYVAGYLAAGVFGQNHKDRLAIGLETGIQNTGISIFLLRLSLPQPAADLTTVVPVAVAIMTPVPLLIFYIALRIHQCMAKDKHETLISETDVTGSIENGKDSAVVSDEPNQYDAETNKDR